MSETENLQVADIILNQSYTDYGFNFFYKDDSEQIQPIKVETFLNFQNKLQTSIYQAIQNYKDNPTQKIHITAQKMFELADTIVKDVKNGFTFKLPIQINISEEQDVQTNSYLDIIKDMFLNFITTTLTDPIYRQVFVVNTDSIKKDFVEQVLQSRDFIDYIREIANSNSMKGVQKNLLNELIEKIKKAIIEQKFQQ